MLQAAAPEISLSLFGLIFAEGFLAFLSPCILPMIPIYLLYLGGMEGEKGKSGRRLLINTLGFVAGFSIVFVVLGATASALGSLISQHRLLLQRLGGVVVIAFGLNYLGVLKIGFLNRSRTLGASAKNLKFWSSLLFGAAFSLGWTPCLGAFLGTALILASNLDTMYQGMALLLTFSLGLGIPFVLTALLWNRLQSTFGFIRRNLKVIQTISGILLILVGVLMLFDLFRFYANIFL
ncbi:MAG: cytochrome c biogenesis CcdA family protein [Bacillota bacterium]|jgi:cytochrome c-type biogenesis protein|nr:cytochrome c biogenesis CcdA family protein [Bacillota bacterium]NLJ02261.1 cytochrome c biogenesis protein CcdA [Bacillota bacterium]